ncbi:MAG: CapA family protein [Clostridia bacterium]|nr:CapA family protein [Clostridia bacterium]
MKHSGLTRRTIIRRALSVLAAAVLVALTGCSGGGEETAPDTTAPSAVTLPGLDTVTEPAQTAEVTVTETEEETDPPETEPEIEPVRLSFIGMGDNIVYNCTMRQSAKGDGYDFLPLYKRVASFIKDADIAFINQETPMCGQKYGYHTYPQFNTPNQMGYDLISLGFDIISFANNHMADMGYDGKKCVSDMIDFTDTLDAFIIGLYRDERDFENIRVYEKEGVTIAFLAYTYETNIFHKKTQPSGLEGAYLPVYDEETVRRQVTAARGMADLVIVSIHWGTENTHNINDEQRTYAQLIADCGADVILGHHPHVVQSIEWLTGQSGNKTLCYYSLGNGLNAQDLLRNMVGIMASFDIVKDRDGARIENPSCIPTFNVMTPNYKNLSLIPLSELTDDIAAKHHCNSHDQKVTVEKAYKIITDNIAEEFLPDYLK